jgi:protein-S-isoprenylcysteine O-methyltransferase Ste14
MSARAAGPGVPFPPPLLFLAGFGLAWWLNSRLEFLIHGTGPSPGQTAIGLLLAVAGFVVMLWGIVTFVVARTSVMPNSPARAVVTSGPYRFTRNPMYLGLTTAYCGFAIVLNMVWPFITLPLVLLAVRYGIIAREERHLQTAFPEEYAAYCARVRRWI